MFVPLSYYFILVSCLLALSCRRQCEQMSKRHHTEFNTLNVDYLAASYNEQTNKNSNSLPYRNKHEKRQ